MKRILMAVSLVLLTASHAVALSCVRSTIEGSYKGFSEAKEQYILVSGSLTNKRNVVLGPKPQGSLGNRGENFTATFVGDQGTRAGFDRPIEITVAVSAVCAGPWCGAVAMDTPMITFLEITPYGHQLSVGPCYGNVFYNPTKDQTRRVLQCLRGGVCEPQSR